MSYKCLVCGFDQMPYSPDKYHICPCCGVEYGVDDAFESHAAIRDEWLSVGGPWFSDVKPYVAPPNWDAWNQLDKAGYSYGVPRPASPIKVEVSSARIPRDFELIRVLRNRPEWTEA